MAVSGVVLIIFSLIPVAAGIRPHILFIVADDLGWNDVGWHNEDMKTPNMDKLAENGIILNSSYVMPVCTPSRTSFMTGYYPYHTGLQHGVILDSQPSYLRGNFTLLPEKLKKLGYVTHMVGKWHLGFCNWKYTPTFRGFDSFFGYYSGEEGYYNHTITRYGKYTGYDFRSNEEVYKPPPDEYSTVTYTKRVDQILSSVDPKTQPLFLYLPFQSVHAPLEVPKKFEEMYAHINDRQRRITCGMVSALDEAIGNITRSLTEKGFMDNLLIIFTTDNGGPTYLGANNLPLRGAKTTIWEGGTKGASFVFSQTLLKKTRYTNTHLIHAVDWFPTILSVAGGSPVNGIDGVDQWETLNYNNISARTGFVYNIDELGERYAIRDGDYKLIEGNPGSYNGWYPIPSAENNSTTWNPQSFPKYQLFNIRTDPTEHFNIADDQPDRLKYMQMKLAQYKTSLVPSFFPSPDPLADPKNYNGAWCPGWC